MGRTAKRELRLKLLGTKAIKKQLDFKKAQAILNDTLERLEKEAVNP